VQLLDVVQNGYAHARSPEFTMTGFFHASEWVRIIGDTTFIVLGVIPIFVGTLKAAGRLGRPTGESGLAPVTVIAATR